MRSSWRRSAALTKLRKLGRRPAKSGSPRPWPISRPPTRRRPIISFRRCHWLRGGGLELPCKKGRSRLSLHGEFIMPVETRRPGFQLPNLPFLGKQPAKAKPKPSAAPKAGAKPELLPNRGPKPPRVLSDT